MNVATYANFYINEKERHKNLHTKNSLVKFSAFVLIRFAVFTLMLYLLDF